MMHSSGLLHPLYFILRSCQLINRAMKTNDCVVFSCSSA